MKTILVPTDFSEVSENAAKYAMELAGFYKNAKVVFFHVYSVPTVIAADIPMMSVPFDEMESSKFLKDFSKKFKDANIETELIVRPGFVVDEILYFLEKRRIDTIVMGITGAGKSEGASGSSTTSIMKSVRQPVFVIPKDVQFKKPQRIALACDYVAIVSDAVVEQIKEYSKLFGAKLLIFDILKKTELVSYEKAVAEVNLENSLEDIDHSLYFPSGDNIPEEMNSFIEKNKADLLIMIPHNYTFLRGLFHHSNTKEMAFHTNVPLISIHE
jgi:nucleotide-binding universal stress UspA family protein